MLSMTYRHPAVLANWAGAPEQPQHPRDGANVDPTAVGEVSIALCVSDPAILWVLVSIASAPSASAAGGQAFGPFVRRRRWPCVDALNVLGHVGGQRVDADCLAQRGVRSQQSDPRP